MVFFCTLFKDDQSNGHLVCSLNRLAPIRKVFLPRLEFLAALMGMRLLRYFSVLKPISIIKHNTGERFSSCFSGDIAQEFRIQQTIFHFSSYQLFFHYKSTLDLWWNGPEWLKEPKDNWPERYSCEDLSLTITKARKWYWAQTRDKANHDSIPRTLSYRGHEEMLITVAHLSPNAWYPKLQNPNWRCNPIARRRHTWKRARVKLILGHNVHVHTWVLRTNGHIITRPVHLVILVE
ncbi:hypothetical protein TNCV_3019851, partial [Trichonephila clavipes]